MKRRLIYTWYTYIGKISAGSKHTLHTGSKSVWGWGNNDNGQLGDNTTTSRLAPVSVLGAKKTFCDISTVYQHSIAIDKNGQVWGWGYNGYGQLGDNSATNRCTPVSILGAKKTFCNITTGYLHSMAIDKNGQVWGWGRNGYGILGNNETASRRTPVSILGTKKTFCRISGGQYHTSGIDKNGMVWGWGYNGYGQLGDNTTTSRRTPISIVGVKKTFCQISSGYTHVSAIDKNGQVWGWGRNENGQLGNNSTISKLTPISILGAKKTFCQIAGNYYNTLCIDKNGLVWGWGNNSDSQLGDNSTTYHLTPISILGAKKTFCRIASGFAHTIAIDRYGRVWGWGTNVSGQVGDKTVPSKYTPVSIVGTKKTFCQIFSLYEGTGGFDNRGLVWEWGYNNYGQLGDNTNTKRYTPVSIVGIKKTFCAILSGHLHVSAIDKNGQVWGWGYNGYGQLGDNTIVSKRTPVSILGAKKTFCRISGGQNYTSGIDKNGLVWGWGNNVRGQLGNNATVSKLTPVSILGANKTFCQITSENFHTAGVNQNGQVWGWGYNSFGQLGDNTTIQRFTPISVLGANKTFCRIASGFGHTIAIDKNGQVWGWGYNSFGQLGNNDTASRRTPVSILGTKKTFCRIASWLRATLAIDKNGMVWGWGENSYGNLGNNTLNSPRTPVSILGSKKTFCDIKTNQRNTVGIDQYGQIWCWGSNNFGELGNSGFTGTPVRVYGL